MSDATATPSFCVISGRQVQQALEGRHREVVGMVEAAYRTHGAGDTVNPPSYFLRFPDRPTSRIIALPASLGGQTRVDGLKWISSFPENVAAGIPRASAVLILNDHDTGYPFACLESSIISATRTAASAALAAAKLTEGGERPRRIGFFGVGLIARYVHEYLRGTGWSFDEYGVFDLSREHAGGFTDYLDRATDSAAKTRVHTSARELVESSDLLVFATTAGAPHVTDPAWFSHNPVVLHLSLRDLSPEVVLGATNVVDDVEHCLKAGTSLHLAEQRVGNREFVDGTLDDVLSGRLTPRRDRPLVFSPFGLGVLDLAVGKDVYDTLRQAGELTVVDDFFHELRRYG
ncbi:2,3-diaminopropionate biosynthesis protein SbnB [Streptacidiphilus sp. MAP12-33]|uniref:2,3-diaminopropionate biosynthesis protein SbnB n=1 Tax=Streptacidiphilus sp. MAP12-33 TaxID=3156266 RepID=UPI0035191D9B